MTLSLVPVTFALFLVSFAPLQAVGLLNKEASGQSGRFPGTEEIVSETRTVCFPDIDSLEGCLKSTGRIHSAVLQKVVVKLQGSIAKPLYPQDLARQMVELAFEDADPLTREERTSNMLFILASLGQTDALFREKLYAYYYGYSAEKFISPRK